MEKARVGFARQMARKILSNCGIIKAPVDIEQVVSKLGYSYIEVPTFFDEIDALFIERDDEKYAAVNANHHPHRKRFSLAHELGHVLLGHSLEYCEEGYTLDNPPTEKKHTEEEKPLEVEANAFAGEMLVPLGMLKEQCKKTQNINELSKIFLVSTQVITIAMLNHQRSLFK